MKKDDSVYLHHILAAIERIEGDFATILTAGQIAKAIPLIQEIQSNTRETAESLREDRLLWMKRDIRAIKAKLGMT
jgi:uncharacterized protein with HEPN domain